MSFPTMLSPGQVPDNDTTMMAPEEWHENLNVHMVCPECREDPPNLVENFSAGDTICGSCGLVLGDRMVDTRSEWRTFANDESGSDDPSRVGSAADPLFYGSQLETSIAWGDGGARSRDLHRAQSKLATDSNNKTLKDAYGKIATLCNSMHLPDDAVKFAQETFKEVHDQRAFRGKNINTTVAACLFIASRRTGHDRTFRSITHTTGVTKKELGKTFKSIEDFVREKRMKEKRAGGVGVPDNFDTGHSATQPSTLVEPMCQKLGASRLVIKIAREVAEQLTLTGVIAGRSPLSIAAVAVYFASHLMGQPKSPRDIAAVADVSDGTIRTSYKPVYHAADRVIKQSWLTDGGKKSNLPHA